MMKFILILALLLSVVSIVSSSVSGRNLKIDIKGANLAYDYIKASSPSAPAVFFLPGLVREKNEGKGISLQSFCKKQDFTFLSADYFGVGRSEGTFADGCLSRWTEDSIHILDKVLKNSGASGRGGIGKTVLVGHGVGSWISFLIAAKRPDLVRGIVGMSSDPDFTEELLWKTLSDDVKEQIMRDGVYEITWGKEKYPITRNLIEDGRKNLLLVGGKGLFLYFTFCYVESNNHFYYQLFSSH